MAAMLLLMLAGVLVVAALTVGLVVLTNEGIPGAWNRRTGIAEALRAHPGILWALAVAAIYAGATYVRVGAPGPDRMMLTAANLMGGASLPPDICGMNDVAMIGGRCYAAL